MNIIIFGGGGFLGRKLAATLLNKGKITINGQAEQPITQLTLFDKHIPTSIPFDDRQVLMEGDICDQALVQSLIAQKPDIIFHLAAIVSGEAEKNLELGMAVNLKAGWDMLDSCRKQKHSPVFVFTSTCGVFGGDVREPVLDTTASTPKNSYGTQKAIIDLLINDYTRRGFIKGRALRLPTIVVRPGQPNAATTSFVSGIIREPLNGQKAVCPVAESTPLWVLSPNKVVENFLHAASLKEEVLGANRHINLPGITVTVKEMVDSLRTMRGQRAADLIEFVPDPFIQGIVLTFPPYFITKRADSLGFIRNENFEEIIAEYVDSEL